MIPATARLVIPSAALPWGLQLAFLTPTIALLLVALYQATSAEVGLVLGIYNAAGFIASLIIPGYADRAGDYLRPLLACGALTLLFSHLTLIAAGCVIGAGYYVSMALVAGPVLLVALQLLNACFVAALTGIGLTLFQDIIPRPGLASGLYSNTRRLGAIASGGLIALAAASPWGYVATFAACGVLTVFALVAVLRRLTAQPLRRTESVAECRPATQLDRPRQGDGGAN